MPTADLSRAAWRTSSRSGANGGECVEVAPVWRKSSFSGANGGDCAEVSGSRTAVAARDSKHPDGGVLLFDRACWAGFTAAVKRDTLTAS